MATIVYIIGCLICYMTIKYLRNQILTNNWIWVILGLIYSLGSWLSLIMLMFIVGLIYIITLIDSEPPKWL